MKVWKVLKLQLLVRAIFLGEVGRVVFFKHILKKSNGKFEILQKIGGKSEILPRLYYSVEESSFSVSEFSTDSPSSS